MSAKAYSYVRFSTPEQAKGHSKSRQVESCEKYCRANGLDLATDEEYTFFDSGKSAFSGDHVGENGQLARFLRMVEDGAIEKGSYLIVESLDRLSREHVMEALPRFMALLRGGINIVTLADSKVYDSKTNIMEIMYSVMIMGRAHEESSTKAMRLGAAWKSKQEKARTEHKPIGSAVPLWLEYTKDNGYQLREERVAVVRRVYKLAIDGYGKAVIAKILNAERISAFKGGAWGASSIDKMLNNRAVLGEYQPYTKAGKAKREPVGAPIENYFPAIIDAGTFYGAKAAIEGRRISKATNQSKRFNVWQGIAKCAICLSPMHVINKGKAPKGNIYLTCANARKGLCSGKVIRLDHSENVFRELLAKVDSLALVQDSSSKINKDLAELEGKLAEQRKRLESYAEGLETNYSESLARITAKCEGDIQCMESDRLKLLTKLATERIVDKADFFSKIDLESYEGRNRANTLLKRLNVLVAISTNADNDGTIYMVFQDNKPLMSVTHLKGKRNSLGGILFCPHTPEQLDRMRTQDFDGTLESAVKIIIAASVRENWDAVTIEERMRETFAQFGVD